MTVSYLGEQQILDQFHRARFVKARGQVIGVELRHRPGVDLTECGGSPVIVQWEPYGEARPLFTLTSADGAPISVDPHISCPVCGDRGRIVNGSWVAMDPAPEGVHDEGPLAPVVVESKLYGINGGADVEKEERTLVPPKIDVDEPMRLHEFVGRLDRWCEICNRPDRDEIHIKNPVFGGDDMPNEDELEEALLDAARKWAPRKEGGFALKDSGERQGFDTGAVRDTQNDKPRFDLVPVDSLYRLAELYRKGAEKYGEANWTLGIPYSRVYASMFRHMMQWAAGDTDEDHLAAVAWNAFALMHYESSFERDGRYAELDDMDRLR